MICCWRTLVQARLDIQLNALRRVLVGDHMKSLSHSPQDYEVVLMVGAGIGVTPFASVLADLVNRLNSKKCKLCKKVRPTRTFSPKHHDASGAHPAVRAAVWYQMQ